MPKGRKLSPETRQEIVRLRTKGYKYKEIRNKLGVGADSTIRNVLIKAGMSDSRKPVTHGMRDYENIANALIRETLRDKRMSRKDFARTVGMSLEKTNFFLDGETDTRLTIGQVKRILRLTGGTFEEVFGNG